MHYFSGRWGSVEGIGNIMMKAGMAENTTATMTERETPRTGAV